MFESGVINRFNKMSTGKMRKKSMNLYPDRFSKSGETEIKQFIGKLSQSTKRNNQCTTRNVIEGERPVKISHQCIYHSKKSLLIVIQLKTGSNF